ncbi:HAMP domain-containing protein [Azospirillum isscasi]|uniref:histidine kinase n=1 Tax=Azospirillum isscasi TaxID=3053926 RepID=A0ABU0WF53_9PROT|nr:cache and HAMP domain-containing protein [Azospirillum isscasi]MDQ2102707.1 cache and HAMP domain-containing protein [Azospirillum isscasi]
MGLLGLCLAPSTLVGLYASGHVGERVRSEATEHLLDVSAQIAGMLDVGMHERWRDMTLVASMINAQGSLDRADDLRDQFETLKRNVPIYAWIGAAETDGRVVASSQRLLEGADVSARPWFRAGTQAPFAGDLHEALLLARTLPPNPNGEPLRFVDIAMPLVRKDGVPLGVLGAHLSWSWANEVAGSVLGRSGGGKPDMDAFVLSREGVVLMGPQDLQGRKLELASVRAGVQGVAKSVQEVWPDGRTYFTAVSPTRGEGDYRGLGWVVLVRRDADATLADVSALQHRILFASLAAALAALMAGWVWAGRLSRPMQALAGAARRLSQGDLATPVPPTRAFAEATSLSASLVRLSMTLDAQRTPAATVEKPVSASREPAAP